MTSPSDPERAIRELDRDPPVRSPAAGRSGSATAAIRSDQQRRQRPLRMRRHRADPLAGRPGRGRRRLVRLSARPRHPAGFWSIGYQPTGGEPERYAARLAPERVADPAPGRRHRGDAAVALAPDAPLEIRRCRLDNRLVAGRAASSSRATSRRCCRRPRPMPPIRRSPSCSCRPKRCRSGAPCSRPGGRAAPTSAGSGSCTG